MRPTALLLSAALLCAVSFRSPLDAQGSAPAPAAPIEDVLSATVVFEGVVIEPDGAPAVGAVVVTSAGGKAVADRDGSFRLETAVPIGAESVQVTAVGRGNRSLIASRSVGLHASASRVGAGTLQLSQGTCQPFWLPTFGHHPGVSSRVHAMAVFDDGSGPALYVGGELFAAGAEQFVNGIARWDGVTWQPLGPGVTATGGAVYSLGVYDDGSGPALYAGGSFAAKIKKWDGASWSILGVVGSTMQDTVRAIAVYDDGSGPALYAGGDFDTASGMTVNGIAKWDGASWTSLGSGVTGGIDPGVYALTVFDDGDGPALYAGGRFSLAGGMTASRIARWDGIGWSKLGNGRSHQVNALVVHDDGSGPALYVGGNFTQLGQNHVARWDGSSWSALGSGMSGGSAPTVSALTVHDDGSGPALYAGGSFTSAGGTAASSIAKWDGSSWSALGSGTSGSVDALASFDRGDGAELVMGGDYLSAGGVNASYIAEWNGASWGSVGDGVDDSVSALAVFDDGGGPALYAGGAFRFAGDLLVNAVVEWDGSDWVALSGGVTTLGGFGGFVNALAVFDDGSGPALYVGGSFPLAGGIAASNIARWNGSSWSALGSGLSRSCNALTVHDDGSGPALFAAGEFQRAGGIIVNHVAKWDGASWSALGSGVTIPFPDPFEFPEVHALTVFDDGSGPELHAGGNFEVAGGVAAAHIARWDGSSWSALGSGADNEVYALVECDHGSGAFLYAGGFFSHAGGVPATGIARWDGAAWSAVGGGTNGSVLALTVSDVGCGQALYAGGSFTLAGEIAANHVAKWNGVSWSALGSGLGGFPSTHALATMDDGDGPALYVGGGFSQALDSGDSHLAKWGLDTVAPTISCPPPVFEFDALGSAPGEPVSFTVTAEDDHDLSPDVVCTPPSGSTFPRGTTLVTCTATDASGNEASCQFTVTVALKARKR